MRRFGGHEDVEAVRARFRRVFDERGDLLHQGLVHLSDLRERDGAVRGHGPAFFNNGGAQRAAFLEAREGARRVERLAPVVAERPRVVAAARAGHLDAAAVAGERPPEGRAQRGALRRALVRVRRERRRRGGFMRLVAGTRSRRRGARAAKVVGGRRGDEEREARVRRLRKAARLVAGVFDWEPRGLGRLRRAEKAAPSTAQAAGAASGVLKLVAAS